jgi:sulfhydrogenase subunit beta (sulfur reductase)
MSSRKLPVGSFVRIDKPELQALVDKLQELGYRTVGPRIAEAAVVFGDLDSLAELPIGWIDDQDGGTYRLTPTDTGGYFDYVVGPHSLKSFLFPPQETILEGQSQAGHWQMTVPVPPARPLAVIGVRGCDLQALRIQDRVFLGDQYVDLAYQTRRENLFLVAVN